MDCGALPRETVQNLKIMAEMKESAAAVVHDDTLLGGLIMVLSNSDSTVVHLALETLLLLAKYPEHQCRMKSFLGMMAQLQILKGGSELAVKKLAQTVYDLLANAQSHSHHQAPLRDTANQQDRPHVQKTKRRNSFFVGGGIGKSKTVTLQVRGIYDREDLDVCRNSLLTVKGVISITFDYKLKRAILRTKSDLKPEVLAAAIARTMTMSAELVVKDDEGKETLVSFRTSAASADKENDNMPDYPDEDSPIKGDNNLARTGQLPDSGAKWGLLKSVGNFLSNNLYW